MAPPRAASNPGTASFATTTPVSAAVASEVAMEDLLKRVDMRGPMISQVFDALRKPVALGGLDKALYLKWVHTPHYYAEEPKYMTFFENSTLEFFSKMVWWMVPLYWLPIIISLVWYNATGLAAPVVCVLAAFGVLYWTLVEYVLHRFVFHMDQWTPNTPNALGMHFVLHGVHHKVPNDRYRLVMPVVPASVLAVVVGCISRVVFLPVLPKANEFMVFYMFMVLGYVCYDLMHYAFHHGTFSHRSLLGRLRKYHLKHHYNDQYDVGFGITSPLWDYVFRTLLPLNG